MTYKMLLNSQGGIKAVWDCQLDDWELVEDMVAFSEDSKNAMDLYNKKIEAINTKYGQDQSAQKTDAIESLFDSEVKVFVPGWELEKVKTLKFTPGQIADLLRIKFLCRAVAK